MIILDKFRINLKMYIKKLLQDYERNYYKHIFTKKLIYSVNKLNQISLNKLK